MWPMMPVPGAAPALVRGEHRPPLRSHEAVPALCSRGSAAASPDGRGGLSPPGRQQELFPTSRMRWGTAGRSGAAGCSSGGIPAGSSAAEGERAAAAAAPFPSPGRGGAGAAGSAFPVGQERVAGWGGMRGLGAPGGPGPFPSGAPASRADGGAGSPPGSVRFVRSGLMHFQGHRPLTPVFFRQEMLGEVFWVGCQSPCRRPCLCKRWKNTRFCAM